MEAPMNTTFDASAHEAVGHDHGGAERRAAALARAEHLLGRATRRIDDQDEQLGRMHGLVTCLLEVGAPLAIVEDSIVRAWSPALESLTGLRRSTAVGARLDRLLPTLHRIGASEWRWMPPQGPEWLVAERPASARIDVLCWVERRDSAAAEAPAVPVGGAAPGTSGLTRRSRGRGW
jgi:PAS domain-containing protein